MLEFVEKLLNSQDNIIDQLKLLRENKDNKEVKKYMRALVKDNNSPYFKYCIDKYYFNKDVKEVKPSIRPLRPLYHLKETKKYFKRLMLIKALDYVTMMVTSLEYQPQNGKEE